MSMLQLRGWRLLARGVSTTHYFITYYNRHPTLNRDYSCQDHLGLRQKPHGSVETLLATVSTVFFALQW